MSATQAWTCSSVRSPGMTAKTSRCSGSKATWSQQSPGIGPWGRLHRHC
jgi:hypothetical protein